MRWLNSDAGRAATSGYDSPSILVLAGLAIVGGVVGWLVGQVSPGSGHDVDTFRNDNWYLVWSAVGAMSCALWLILGYFGFHLLRRLVVGSPRGKRLGGRLGRLLGLIASYLVLGLVVSVLQTAFEVQGRRFGATVPLAHFIVRSNIFTVIGLIGSLPNAVGLWWILLSAREMHPVPGTTGQVETKTLEKFRQYQQLAQSFLGMTATAVAAAVALTGALRRALLGSEIIQQADYPAEFVLIYGALFALALAFVYLPTASTLRRTGHALRDVAALALLSTTGERPPNEIARWLKLQEHRSQMDKALGLELGIMARIQLALGLLAPVLVSLLSTVLPGTT
jgi:hypothetical protein